MQIRKYLLKCFASSTKSFLSVNWRIKKTDEHKENENSYDYERKSSEQSELLCN